MNITDKQLGYIVGLFVGDGYSNYNPKDRHYKVEFYLNSLKDKAILDYLCKLLQKLNLKYFISKDKRYNVMRVKINSKEFMNLVLKHEKELTKINPLSNYAIGLLSGFTDAEGYVKHGEIVLTQRDKKVILIFKRISDSLNITRKLWSAKNPKSTKRIWRMRISTRFKYLPHNSIKLAGAYHSECEKHL